MTPAEKAAKENEILTWMHKEGYDRRASSAIAPIIVKYLDEVAKNISPNPDVIWRSEQLAISALQKIIDMQRVNDSYADTCSTMKSVASGALAEIANCK